MRILLPSTLAALCVVTLAASPVPAQESHIRIFADTDGRDCHPVDLLPNVFQIHVVQILTQGSQSAEFTVSTGGGFDGVFLGETLSLPDAIQVGNAGTGTAIALGVCVSGPVHFLTMNYFCQGQSAPCSFFEVTEYVRDNYRGLNYVNCDFVKIPASGGKTFVNGGPDCPCDIPGVVTPVEETTWGLVKAMYE